LTDEDSMTTHIKHISNLLGSTALLAAGLGWAAPSVAAEAASVQMAAADTPAAKMAKDSKKELEEVVVTGTRFSGLKASDSPAPVQLVSVSSLQRTGQVDLRLSLANLVPSFTAQGFGGDTANLTLSAALRGLSPNHTLVLVNGKRRHSTANLAVLGGSYQGAAAADLNFIPIAAIDHVEVLQDGAAAQYGTDAIAGVINIFLKDAPEGGMISTTAGKYMFGDGTTTQGSGSIGMKPTANSFLDLAVEARYHGFSDRGLDDQRLFNPASPQYSRVKPSWLSIPGYPHLNKISGDARYHLYNGTFNGGIDVNNDVQFYAFGSYGKKDASAFENYRRPLQIVGKNPNDLPFPLGFMPRERIIEDDYQISAGVKFKLGGWDGDLSTSYGFDQNQVRTEDSANAPLYLDTSTLTTPGYTPQSFLDGYFIASQLTNNLDFRKAVDFGLSFPVNVAIGLEQRTDTFEIKSGDPASYYKAGAQSYPGFRPSDAGSHSRDDFSGYIDFAAEPIKALHLDGAVRFEHYTDFGDTTVGKVNGRYDLNDKIAFRGTISTGFRAPTLAEEYYSATNVSPTSAIVQLPPNSPAAALLGVSKLKPETSNNYSFGAVVHPFGNVTATIDAYEIDIADRIFGSSQIFGLLNGVVKSPAVTAAILANGNILDSTVATTGVSLFLNGIDTRTRGLDLVVTMPTDLGTMGNIDWSLTGNYNKTKVTKVAASPAIIAATGTVLFGADSRSNLETAHPEYKVSLGANYILGKLGITFRETVYGKSSNYADPGNGVFQQVNIGTKFITDLEASYRVFDGITVALGANNLFDTYPDKLTANYQATCIANSGACVTQYPSFSPFGINGGYYYGRVTVNF
jgi:iron complex outermembrane receptor protein